MVSSNRNCIKEFLLENISSTKLYYIATKDICTTHNKESDIYFRQLNLYFISFILTTYFSQFILWPSSNVVSIWKERHLISVLAHLKVCLIICLLTIIAKHACLTSWKCKNLTNENITLKKNIILIKSTYIFKYVIGMENIIWLTFITTCSFPSISTVTGFIWAVWRVWAMTSTLAVFSITFMWTL